MTTLQFLAAAIAACASLTAVVLGIDQLSSGARLRSLENTLRSAGATPDGSPRDEVVASLHRTTLARLIAREAVPPRVFLFPSILVMLPIVSQVRAGLTQGTPWFSAVGYILFSGVFMGFGLTHLVNLARERARIRHWYEQGLTPLRAFTDLLARMEGGPRNVIVFAYLDGVAASFTIYYLFATAGGGPQGAVLALVLSLVVLIPMAQQTLAIAFANLGREPSNRDKSLRPTWEHPVPLTRSGAAIIGSNIEGSPRTEPAATSDEIK